MRMSALRNTCAILVLALVACKDSDSGVAGSPAGASTTGASGARPAAPAIPVDVAAVAAQTVIDAIVATGQIEAAQAIELRPETEGRLAEILMQEGAEVKQGTPLFKVDDGELKAQVARLEADRDLAEQALTRTKDLMTQNASSA